MADDILIRMPHIHDKIDFTVEVFVVHNQKVLLRKHDKYGIWLSVGGHIELGEDPNEAAVREVKEEVGLDIEILDSRVFKGSDQKYKELVSPVSLNRHNVSPTHEHVCLVYFAKSSTDQVVPEKTSDVWKWCSEEDVDQLDGISPNVSYYAKRAIKEVR